MKRDICITKFDYYRLIDLLKKSITSGRFGDFSTVKKLKDEIKRAKKVDPRNIASDYVTMNSVFELSDLGKPAKHTFKLVFPNEADMENGKISVLAPTGSAVLGYRVGDVVKWNVSGGEKFYQISKIIYQPEANGDYHL